MFRSVIIAAFVVSSLAACGSTTTPSTVSDGKVRTDLSLVQTKSPVQLLRNDVAGKVPKIAIEGVAELEDTSVACGGADDTAGVARSWLSTATFLVTNSRAATIDNVIAKIAADFENRDWVKEAEGNATVLTSGLSPATITLEAIHKDDAEQPAIRISTSGPCVETDGADSDEVTTLEGDA